MSRLALSAAFAMGAIGSAMAPLHAQSASSSAPAPDSAVATKAKGLAAWQRLTGNTAVAESRAGGYTEFYAPDGVVKHLDRDGRSTGKWSLQGEKVCFDFPEEDDRSCVDVEIDGQKGVFIDEDATKDTFDLLPGNAKNL